MSSKITKLFGVNQERLAKISQWHQQQADLHAGTKSVATLNISITESSEIVTSAVAIEPEHALIMLPELERLTALLREHVQAHGLTLPGEAPAFIPARDNVVSFPRAMH